MCSSACVCVRACVNGGFANRCDSHVNFDSSNSSRSIRVAVVGENVLFSECLNECGATASERIGFCCAIE